MGLRSTLALCAVTFAVGCGGETDETPPPVGTPDAAAGGGADTQHATGLSLEGGAAVLKAYKATKDHVGFGSTGLNCKDAIKPYIAVCSTEVSASIWNGKALKAVKGAQDFSGLVVVGKGDELRFDEVK